MPRQEKLVLIEAVKLSKRPWKMLQASAVRQITRFLESEKMFVTMAVQPLLIQAKLLYGT
jgi:hypothetical protein